MGLAKSTLMKLLVAALLPTKGEIRVDGHSLTKTERLLKAQLGYLPQDFGLFDELTVTQFLDYMAALKGIRDSKAAIQKAIQEVQSGGKGPSQNSHAVRWSAPTGGYCAGNFGRPSLPDF